MRDNSVSIAKAIAILLMVLAHTWFMDIGDKWINMFHMPLFFFMAGYCFKKKYLADFKTFASKRVSGLYKPFVKWSLVFLVFHNVFFHLNIYNGEYGFRGNVSQLYSLTDFASRAITIVTSMAGNEQLLGGYWFMKSLFVGSFIAYFFIRYVKNSVIRGGYLLVLLKITSAFNLSIPFFHISGREFMAAMIFTIGYSYKKQNLQVHHSWWCVLVGLFLVTIGVCYWQASLIQYSWEFIVPFLISAIAGTMMVFKLSCFVNSKDNWLKRFLVYIGENTLTVLTWHFISFKIVSLIIIYFENLPIERLAEFPVINDYTSQGWFILYFVTGMVVPLMLTKLKYLK